MITASGGALVLGDANAANGFAFEGTLEVADQDVSLLDADAADLGLSTVVAGGSLTSLNGIQLGTGETLSGAGTVDNRFTNQGTVTGNGGGLNFSGVVDGAGSFLGDVTFSGVYAPGNSPASVELGNPTFDNALELDIGGFTPGSEHDFLDVQGLASLGGTLELSYLDNFAASAGDRFTILDAAGLDGTFDSVNFPDAQEWSITYSANEVTVGVVIPLPTPAMALGAMMLDVVIRRTRRRPATRSMSPSRRP